ncbi:hypothetical protein A3Q56_03572 [Intoshia linei]|uniref:Nuclear receptor n=1 Tax=Intoshia linei TaxID=1819745 RepID=A0A177B4R6_9BILA|nr:hypothetical protein A3Q56_03572 [Intoshia linei]
MNFNCEGCKGFFKRTVRKNLVYSCRDERNCIIDKRQRNRCQHCRYRKCINTGMKKEAVQEERRQTRMPNTNKLDEHEKENNPLYINGDADDVARVMNCYKIVENFMENAKLNTDIQSNRWNLIIDLSNKYICSLVLWIKNLKIEKLTMPDILVLIRQNMLELQILYIAFKSRNLNDALFMDPQLHLSKNYLLSIGCGQLYNRIKMELIIKLNELKMDENEFNFMSLIILFNPLSEGLDFTIKHFIGNSRDQGYLLLSQYCKVHYPTDSNRFARLLLRLPGLRSISLKVYEQFDINKANFNCPPSILYDVLANKADYFDQADIDEIYFTKQKLLICKTEGSVNSESTTINDTHNSNEVVLNNNSILR